MSKSGYAQHILIIFIIPYPSPPSYQIPFFEIVRIYANMWSARNDMCEQKPFVLNLEIALHSSESIPVTLVYQQRQVGNAV